MTTTSTSNTKTNDVFFNLHTTGLGYISRIREVTPKHSGDTFLACTVAALRGKPDAEGRVLKTWFDVRVVAEEPKRLIKMLLADHKDAKIIANFTIADFYPEIFEYQHGEKKGQHDATLKGRLIKISYLKIDDKVYSLNVPQEPKGEEKTGIDKVDETLHANDANDANDFNIDGFINQYELDTNTDGMIVLDPMHEHFSELKTTLKQNGFTWNNSAKAWDNSNVSV